MMKMLVNDSVAKAIGIVHQHVDGMIDDTERDLEQLALGDDTTKKAYTAGRLDGLNEVLRMLKTSISVVETNVGETNE